MSIRESPTLANPDVAIPTTFFLDKGVPWIVLKSTGLSRIGCNGITKIPASRFDGDIIEWHELTILREATILTLPARAHVKEK